MTIKKQPTKAESKSRELFSVVEVQELDSPVAVNELLATGHWILLKVFIDLQLCYKKVTLENTDFVKIQPYNVPIRVYVVGRVE